MGLADLIYHILGGSTYRHMYHTWSFWLFRYTYSTKIGLTFGIPLSFSDLGEDHNLTAIGAVQTHCCAAHLVLNTFG